MLGRYFYFESNGSSRNTGNHLVEVQIVDIEGVNRALGRGLLRYSAISGSSDPARVTDGDTSYLNYFDFGTGKQYVVIDLGDVYDISYINVWRYYSGSRIYKDIYIRVSLDDVNYTTVFSSNVNGTYTETSAGKRIDILNMEHEEPEGPIDPTKPVFYMPLNNSLEYIGKSHSVGVSGSADVTFEEDAYSATAYNQIMVDLQREFDVYTIFLRFKMRSTGGAKYPRYRRLIYGLNAAGNQIFPLEVGYTTTGTTNKLVFSKSFTDALDDGNWHTCVIKQNGGTITCTIDDTFTDTKTTTAGGLQSFVLSQVDYVFNGLIKDVRVYGSLVDNFDDDPTEELVNAGTVIINGAAFTITEGTVMLGGVVCKITEGMTIVDGAVKRITL